MYAVRTSSPASARPATDRRRHFRIALKLRGRFLNELGEEHAFVTSDISCGGARIISRERVPAQARIVCYFDQIGRVTCKVVRQCSDGFAVSFVTPQHKRDKLADRLTWLSNKDALGLTEERAAPRHAANGPAVLKLEDGRSLHCRVLDISMTGAGLEATTRAPMIGDIVTAGTLRGEVVRADGRAFGVRWLV